MKNIQTNLLSAFESSGLTYDELAKRTNLPKSALYRYINGDTEKIPIDRFQAICAELKVDAGQLLGWKSGSSADMLSYHPKTYEGAILARGIDQCSPEEREQALSVVQALFAKHADYFRKENDDGTEL